MQVKQLSSIPSDEEHEDILELCILVVADWHTFCCAGSCVLVFAAEHRQISDTEYKQFTDTIIDKLIDAERVTSLMIKDLAAAAAATAASSVVLPSPPPAATPTAEEQAAASRRYGRGYVVLDENFVADAAAEELREHLQQLAKQVVDLQVGNRACTLNGTLCCARVAVDCVCSNIQQLLLADGLLSDGSSVVARHNSDIRHRCSPPSMTKKPVDCGPPNVR
jgi:hypothetical protein